MRQTAIAAALLALAVVAFSSAAGAGAFDGVWVIRHRATLLPAMTVFSEDAKDQKVIEIRFDEKSGKVKTVEPALTPEMRALNYEPYDIGFEGVMHGDVAVGTSTYGGKWKAPFWDQQDARVCLPAAGLRSVGAHKIELIEATWTRETCEWTFEDFSRYESAQRIVITLEPLFVAREFRFFDQDQSPGRQITAVTDPNQKFIVELEFEVPPPAAIYVGSANYRLIVRPTNNPSVFRSDVVTRAGLLSGREGR